MYDDIAREPLPQDVVELIERDGRESAAATTTPVDAAAPQPPSSDRPQGDKD